MAIMCSPNSKYYANEYKKVNGTIRSIMTNNGKHKQSVDSVCVAENRSPDYVDLDPLPPALTHQHESHNF